MCRIFFSLSKHPSKRDYHTGKVEGLKFGEDILEQGMSWPSQTCPGTARSCCFLDSRVHQYPSSTRGACPLSRKKMSSVIRFVWFPDRYVMVDLTKGA